MRLTQHTDYSLRVLMYAATLWGSERLASIQEIASSYGISENHLMKVVHRLALEGLLETKRGRNGGLGLAREPSSIRVGEVVRKMEDLELVSCFGGESDCPLAGGCALTRALQKARASFLAELDEVTLADLVPRQRAGQPVAFPASLRRKARA